MAQFKHNLRHTLAWMVNLILIVLTVIISVAGYQAYLRLDNMVNELQENAEPNYNLLILKEVSFFVNEMEREVESYRNNPKPEFLRNFNEALNDSQYLLDSLKSQYSREELKDNCDSLSYLIKERAKIQTKLTAVNDNLLGNTLEELTARINEIPKALAAADTVEKTIEKRGLIKRIFTRKQKNDTIQAPSQSEILQNEIMSELAKAKEESTEKDNALQYQLAYLERESRVFQDHIIDLIDTMEDHELEAGRTHVKSVQRLAKDTNREVVIFSALSSALLLITLISQLNYVGRNRKYQAILREAKRNAEYLAIAKEKFLANMSHEIRTPMNAIAGFTNQLLKSAENGEQKEQLQIIKSSSDHLLHLLNDILDLSKLQASKVTLNKQSFDLHQLLRESTSIFQEMANKKGLDLKLEMNEVPQFVIGDEQRIRQILLNLIHNAIKFTDSGYVKLITSFKKVSGDLVKLRLEVKDSGIGIPKDKQSKIFEEFEQANTDDQSKGTGLGLAISAMLVKLHEGQLTIESELKKGTSMIVSLPVTLGHTKDTSEGSSQKISVRLNEISILIADDEPFNLKLLEAIFKGHNINLVMAKDGKEAMQFLKDKSFDIAILDAKMPGYTGWEVVQRIRREGGINSEIPMIALTATISEDERKQSIKAGFNHILKKPFNEEELLALIQGETTKRKAKAIMKVERPDKAPNFDLTSLSQMGDQDFVDEMIRIFKSSSARSIENCKKAVKFKIRDGISNEAHKMLPPARHLSAIELVKALEGLQRNASKESFDQLSARIVEIESLYMGIKEGL
ncbi:MAG: signal transduction histidine kinase/FixJ family two-component response regulator [Roseivirga sp.]|jgi:signal transduction histidine kinase/FixJ family two-component response regulator